MYLTHNETGNPVAMFVDAHENITMLYTILDERMFSDTVFRAVRLNSLMFVLYDIRHMNGSAVHEKYNYEQRMSKIKDILANFHHPDLVSLVTPDEVSEYAYPIRGYEYYDEKPGSMGVFLPAVQ